MNISVMYKIYHRSCDFSTRLHGSAPTGLSGRSFMRRLMDAVRGKVDVKSRQSLGILRRSVSYGGQGILKTPADLVATPPCAQRSEGASFSATRRAGATAGYIFYKN